MNKKFIYCLLLILFILEIIGSFYLLDYLIKNNWSNHSFWISHGVIDPIMIINVIIMFIINIYIYKLLKKININISFNLFFYAIVSFLLLQNLVYVSFGSFNYCFYEVNKINSEVQKHE